MATRHGRGPQDADLPATRAAAPWSWAARAGGGRGGDIPVRPGRSRAQKGGHLGPPDPRRCGYRTPTPPERVVTEQWPGAPLRARGPTAPSAPLKPQHLQTTEGCLQGARCPSREGHAGVPRVSRNGLTAPRGTHRPAQYPTATGAGDGVGASAFSSRHVALSTLLRGLGKGLDWAPLGRGGVAVPGASGFPVAVAVPGTRVDQLLWQRSRGPWDGG